MSLPLDQPTPATPVIALRGIGAELSGARVLDQISLEVASGEVLALLGPSGSGKSTLLRLVMGFVAPSEGELRLRGELASAAGRVLTPPRERDLAVVFQDLALWPHLSVAGNLAFGLRAKGAPRAERRARIARALEDVELSDKAARLPAQLSGGERQRVAIARALVLEPSAILLDEPLSNLDLGLKGELLDLFSRLFRAQGAAVIYVTHSPWEATRLADRVALLDRGRLVYSGALADLPPDLDSPFSRAVHRALNADRRGT